MLVEMKSAQTPSRKQFAVFDRLAEALAGAAAQRIVDRIVVYGGAESERRSKGRLVSWRDLDAIDWAEPTGDSR